VTQPSPAPCDKAVQLRVHRSKQPCICASGGRGELASKSMAVDFDTNAGSRPLKPRHFRKQFLSSVPTAAPREDPAASASRREKHQVFGIRLAPGGHQCFGEGYVPQSSGWKFYPLRMETLRSFETLTGPYGAAV
jgi:hypothetical protein